MASVEGNSLRSCASDTPEASAISTKPICSIGLSARRLRNAAMIFSRSPAGSAASRPEDGAEDLRAGLRADLRADLLAMGAILQFALNEADQSPNGPPRGSRLRLLNPKCR